MARAYLRISVETGKERSVRDALLKIGGVRSADLTSGDQDIISLVEGESYEGILTLVVGEVRKVEGIRSTVTNLVLE